MTAAALSTDSAARLAVSANNKQRSTNRVIIIGIDGMDPRLCEKLMSAGQLPNLARFRQSGGYRALGTSIPPQSPVAWANFINGAGPGSHGIFDFIHRDPAGQAAPFFSVAKTVAGEGYWKTGKHKLQLDFWPFNHKPPKTVLQERLKLLEYAFENYDDGLLFFYFSSTDLQSHMFWWDSDLKHPTRSAEDAEKCFGYIHNLYNRLDSVVGDILRRYGDKATIIVMSDHGFANFKRQFNLNTWLRENGYLYPPNAGGILIDVDWSRTRAYGLGINGLYLNLKGRERDGIVEPGEQREQLLDELSTKLEAVRDTNGKSVIVKVHRTDKTYSGPATTLAPDLVIGYCRNYRASWSTCLGDMTREILLDNDSAWSADHCADASEVPGVIFSNRPISTGTPALIDIAPSVLTRFGLKIPPSMQGENIFVT